MAIENPVELDGAAYPILSLCITMLRERLPEGLTAYFQTTGPDEEKLATYQIVIEHHET